MTDAHQQGKHNLNLPVPGFAGRIQAQGDATGRRWRLFGLGAAVIALIVTVGALSLPPGGGSTASAAAVAGTTAPDFTLPATTGGTITLSDLRRQGRVLLYFHEGLSCDPCMQQVGELEKIRPDLEALNVTLLSVTFDPVDELRQAEGRYGVKTIPVLSYHDAHTEVDYDLTRFSMGMGRRAGHTFVLVDTDGVIRWRKDYWPGIGMMVAGGVMFVPAADILHEVKRVVAATPVRPEAAP